MTLNTVTAFKSSIGSKVSEADRLVMFIYTELETEGYS